MRPGLHLSTAGPFIVALSLAAGVCAATPSFDCAQARSGAETLICDDAMLADLDRQLAARFAAAVAAVKALDADSDAALKDLRARQRGWIKGRDDCWKADNLRDCVAEAYRTRDGELVAQWMLQDPIASVAYICAQNPANEVHVFFFDTELPSIRLEYGDTIRTGSLVNSASGSKYATGFGTEFWIKGKTAVFTPAEGHEMTCVEQP